MVWVARHSNLIKQDINETRASRFEQLVQESYDDFVRENGTDRELEIATYSQYFVRHPTLVRHDLNKTKENQFRQLVQECYGDFTLDHEAECDLETAMYSQYFDLLLCYTGGRNYFVEVFEKEKAPFLKYWTRIKKQVLATFRHPKWYSELSGAQYKWSPLKVLVRSEEFLPYAESFVEKWESEHVGKVEITQLAERRKVDRIEQLIQEAGEEYIQDRGAECGIRIKKRYREIPLATTTTRERYYNIAETKKVPFLKYFTRTRRDVLASITPLRYHNDLEILVFREEFLPHVKAMAKCYRSERLGYATIEELFTYTTPF